MEWVIGSFIAFNLCRVAVKSLLVPNFIRSGGKVTEWKWVNTVDSLIHSLVTGIGSLICFYLYPETATDVVNSFSYLSYDLTALSVGYFFFDFFDMLLHHRKRSSYELMVHHFFVISCFGVSIWSKRYLGFAMVAMVIEINSVFLHWRQLLVLQSCAKSSTYYRTVSLLNLITFLFFRIVTLGWMMRWLAVNKHKVPWGVYTLGCTATLCIVGMSVVLFLRVFKSDFRSNQSHTSSYHSNIRQ